MDLASKVFTNCWAELHAAYGKEAIVVPFTTQLASISKKTYQRAAELKRKADDVHERTRSHRERCRRGTKEHTKSEAAVYHKMGCLGLLVKDTVDVTHALTCGVPDRESNEAKYLHEATEMIEEWQTLVRRRSSSSHPTSQPSGIIFAPVVVLKNSEEKGNISVSMNVMCSLLFMKTVQPCL